MRRTKNLYLLIILMLIIISGIIVLTYNNTKNKPIYNSEVIKVIDFWGRDVSFENIPNSIISLSPSVTENLFQIGLGDKIIGISKEISGIESVSKIDTVSSYEEIDIKKILSMKPDVIFASKYTYKEVCEVFEKNNIPILFIEPSNYNQMQESLQMLGNIFEKNQVISELKSKLKDDIKKLSNNSLKIKPRILFIQEISPLYIVGNDTFINDIIKICGGTNAANRVNGYFFADNEEFNNFNIDIIIFSKSLKGKVSIDDLKSNTTFMNTNAVKNDNVFFATLDDEYINPTTKLEKQINEIGSYINIFTQKQSLENSNE